MSLNKQRMKRIGNLYDRIISVENLILADKKARKGKLRQYGVVKHIENEKENISILHELLDIENLKLLSIKYLKYMKEKKEKYANFLIIQTE